MIVANFHQKLKQTCSCLLSISIALIFLLTSCSNNSNSENEYELYSINNYIAADGLTQIIRDRHSLLLSSDDMQENTKYFQEHDVSLFFPLYMDDTFSPEFISLEHLEHMLTHEQRYEHAVIISERMSVYLGINIAPEEISKHLGENLFSWLDFVTLEQFEIAISYLGIAPNMFFDELIHLYPWVAEPQGIIREIRLSLTREKQLGIPTEFAPDDPQRILAQMIQDFEDFTIPIVQQRSQN
ncbi:MAG: hypothetical protein FWE34_06335 [Defluviitaleaceae bacterium]|nr:hypothetical protein [Defluviitaleaceae bacterium]